MERERESEGEREKGRSDTDHRSNEQHRLRMRNLTSAFHTCAGDPPRTKTALGVSVWLLLSPSIYLSVGYLSVNDRTVFYFSAAS